MLFATIIFYPSFKDQATELQKGFENIPDAALQLLGGSADFFSPVGFLNSQVFFLVLPLVLGILSIGLGSSLLAKEEQDGTIEALLARPVSRRTVLFAKLLAGTAVISLVSMVGFVTTLVLCSIVDIPISTAALAGAYTVCLLMSLTFFCVAFAFTAAGKARSASLGVTAVVALGGYIVSSLAGTVSWLSVPSKVFPFYYYQSEALLTNNYSWTNALYFVGLIACCVLVSLALFDTRDIG
jgi:ABC-2 type transport system permease protein